MPRIPAIDPTTASGVTADHLATARKMFGGTPNMINTAAQSPAAVGAMLGMFANLGKASLGAKVGEQIAIAIAQANGCGYCLSAHTVIGRMHGLSDAELNGARQPDSVDTRTKAILTLAVGINRTRGHIDDATLAAARHAGLNDAELVEVVAHVALNVFTNYLNNVSETTIDFPEVALDAVV